MLHQRLPVFALLAGATAWPTAVPAADRLSLSLGGHFSAFVVVGSQDDGPGEPGEGVRGHGIGRESEIRFQARTKLDNGLRVGVRVELEGETSRDQIDESYIWFEGAFGRFEFGSTNGAAKNLWIGEPEPILRHGLNDGTFRHFMTGGNLITEGESLIALARDRDKAAYYSPRFAGFQLGVSYTPDFTEELGFALRPDTNARQQSEIVEIGANYEASIGDVDVGAYVGYGRGDLEVAAAGMRDRRQWGTGLSLSYAGFTVGASYREDNLGTSGSNTDLEDFFVAGEYRTGPWSAGIQYGYTTAGAGAGLGEDVLEAVEVGGSYAVGPGVTLIAGVQWFDFRDNASLPANENNAVIGVFGVHTRF